MFKVPVYWLDGEGNEAAVIALLHSVPHTGDWLDLSPLASAVAADFPEEAKHLERMLVLAVEHATGSISLGDGLLPEVAKEPTLRLLLERNREDQHQLDLEEKDELAASLRKTISRLTSVLESFTTDFSFGGKFALVANETDNPRAPDTLLVFQMAKSCADSDVPPFALEMADAVFIPNADPGVMRFRCVKHRYREFPFELSWTGVVT